MTGINATPATNINVNNMGKLIFLGYGMHCTLKAVLFPLIINEFSISFMNSGLMLASITIAFLASIITSGYIVQKIGERTTITYNTFGLVLTSILMITAANIYSVLIAIIISGWCYGSIECITTAFVKRYNPKQPHIAVNRVFSLFCIGSCISALLGGYLVYIGLNWRLCYIYVCLICLIGGIFSTFITDKGYDTLPKIRFSQVGKLLRNKPFILGCIATAFFVGTETSTSNWMTVFLTESNKMNIFESAGIVALFYASLYIGRILCGFLLQHFKGRKLAFWMSLCGAILISAVAFIRSSLLMWFAIGAFGFMISGLYPLLISSTSSLANEGMVYSVTFFSMSIGSIFTNTMTGMISDILSMQSAFIFNGILLSLVAFLVFINRKNYDKVSVYYEN